MHLIHIHINNDNEFCDNRVVIKKHLPFIPRKGDIIHLNQDDDKLFQEQICNKLGTMRDYAHCFYGHSHKFSETHKEKDVRIEDCQTGDFSNVDAILIRDTLQSITVHIELTN